MGLLALLQAVRWWERPWRAISGCGYGLWVLFATLVFPGLLVGGEGGHCAAALGIGGSLLFLPVAHPAAPTAPIRLP